MITASGRPLSWEGMRYRKLGGTGMEVSEVGYGAWGIGGKQWLGGTDEESVAALSVRANAAVQA